MIPEDKGRYGYFDSLYEDNQVNNHQLIRIIEYLFSFMRVTNHMKKNIDLFRKENIQLQAELNVMQQQFEERL